MQNLAYKIEVPMYDETPTSTSVKPGNDSDVCAACGEPLFGPDAVSCSWQSWCSFWEIFAVSNVELVCGACGEYLQRFFNDRK